MFRCEVCGNEYDKPMVITWRDHSHTFDCFECAIQAQAPICLHCGCRVLGHGVEAEGRIYCCASCATRDGVKGLCDRVRVRLATVE
jgi:hypothetical protein